MEKRNENTFEKYSPPKAVFVPLKFEERLMACGKLPAGGWEACTGPGKPGQRANPHSS